MNILQNIMPTKRRDNMPDGTIPQTIAVPRPLEDRAKQLKEKHYADYAHALEERDRAVQERDQAMERVRLSDEACAKASHRIAGLAEEIAHLKQRLADQEADFKSRLIGFQLERDQAVAIAGELKGTLGDIKAVVNRHETPAPRVASDVEAPNFADVLPVPTHKEMLRLVEKMSKEGK